MSHFLIEKILVGYIEKKETRITTTNPAYNEKYREFGRELRFNGDESKERFISVHNWGAFERCNSLVSMVKEYLEDDIQELTTIKTLQHHNKTEHLTKGVPLYWEHQVYFKGELYIEKKMPEVAEIGGTEEYEKRLDVLAQIFLEKYLAEQNHTQQQ